ncbi:MAG: branched-chain amino acid ABC transporter permease [Comamonadaceae bacterium]|nr:branched-chain amino acid ABC transporter permease [Comamonadaceae bacterium]
MQRQRQPSRMPAPLWLAAALIAAPWLGGEYWLNAILVPFLVLALAGIGLNLLTGYAGQVSLGSGGFMAAGAFATYAFVLRAGLDFVPAMLCGGLVAALAGLLFGLPSARIKGFYLMVTSLAAQFFLEWLFLKFPWFYNHSSSATISAPRLGFLGFELNHPLGRYYLVLGTVALLTWVALNLVRSQTGRDWMAIRDMDTAAAVAGIRVHRGKVLAFAVSAFFLGVAGALWAFAYLGSAGVQSFGLTRSFQILFIAIIGGLGSIGGNFIGAAFICLLPLALDFVSQSLFAGRLDAGLLQNVQKVVFGVLIIGFLIKEPEGMARLAADFHRHRIVPWRARLSAWRARAPRLSTPPH